MNFRRPIGWSALLLLLALTAACQTAAPAPLEAELPPTEAPAEPTEVEPTEEPEPTESPTTEPEVEVEEVEEPAAESRFDTIDPNNLTDDDIEYLSFLLIEGSRQRVVETLLLIERSGDERFVPVLMEFYWSGLIGVSDHGRTEEVLYALESISGENLADNWFAWTEWYGGTDIEPHESYIVWKSSLFSRIDPNFEQFFDGRYETTIRPEEIVWGGVLLDGIPALDQATQVDAEAGELYFTDDEPVFGLSINGDHRAYPLSIMDWHEMANDVVGGVPVSIAYCTLCGAAVAYDGRASNGETYDFGSSGFLFRSNKLMYDRQTRTLWNQLTGEPVYGELVGQDVELEVLPIVLTTWADWREQHPDTTILSINTGHLRDYRLGAAYGHYFSSENTMFPVWQRSDILETKDQVFAMRLNNVPKAYPIETLVEEQVSNDLHADIELVLVTTGGIVEASGNSIRAGRVTYDTGAQVRAYERNGQTFSPGEEPFTVVDEAGEVWQVTEEALISPSGEELDRLGGHLAYWFGWFAFFPNTAVYGVDVPAES